MGKTVQFDNTEQDNKLFKDVWFSLVKAPIKHKFLNVIVALLEIIDQIITIITLGNVISNIGHKFNWWRIKKRFKKK